MVKAVIAYANFQSTHHFQRLVCSFYVISEGMQYVLIEGRTWFTRKLLISELVAMGLRGEKSLCGYLCQVSSMFSSGANKRSIKQFFLCCKILYWNVIGEILDIYFIFLVQTHKLKQAIHLLQEQLKEDFFYNVCCLSMD